MKTLLLAAGLGIFLTGCATNPVAQFYQDQKKNMPVTLQQKLLPPSNAEPRLISATPGIQRIKIARGILEQGYVLIGFSAYQGPAATEQQLVDQAKKVGADIVLFTSEFMGSQQGVRPIINYQPGQTYTTTESGTINANAYGSGGYASGFGTYSGSATTTSSGTFNTQYVPYQYNTYQTGAGFYQRMKPGVFGARLQPIPIICEKPCSVTPASVSIL
jgi:hypothetical protein